MLTSIYKHLPDKELMIRLLLHVLTFLSSWETGYILVYKHLGLYSESKAASKAIQSRIIKYAKEPQ